MKNRIGLTIAGVWLVLEGLIRLADLSFDYQGAVMGALAVVGGVLIVIRQ